MSKTIWKYALEISDSVELSTPKNAQILTIQVQSGTACMWVLVDPARASETRRFQIIGTGHPIENDPGKYIGTFQIDGGNLVFHVFEILNS